MTRLIAPVLLLMFAVLTGCGESSRVTGSGSVTPTIMLMSIAVGPPDTTVALGITTQFSATGLYSDGSKQDISGSVTWSSSTPTVATISNAIGSVGMASPVATGSSTIAATLGSIKGSTTLTVSPATLVSIAVTPTASSVAQGSQVPFTATGTYSDESTKNITNSVTWTSSLVSVATISNTAGSQGLTQAVAAGMTTLTATLGSITGSTTLTVTAEVLVSIAVTPATASIANGTSQQFVATGTYADGTTQTITTAVTWSSSNATVAAISNTAGSQGRAKGASVGSVTLTATLGTISGTATLNVTAATLVSVAVTPATPTIAKGTHVQFVATGTYTDATTQVLTTTATWISSVPSVATVSNAAGFDGYAIGVGVGTTVISATVNGIAGSTVLTVTPATLVSIGVTPTNPSVALGFHSFAQFTATGIYSDNTTQDLTTSVMWTSSNTNIAIISNGGNNGQASLLNVGTTTITAALNGVSGSTTLTVTSAVLVSIKITPATPNVVVGSTESFTATGTYSDNSQQDLTTSVTWTSGTPATASISTAAPNNGVATALAAGTSTIKAAVGTVNGTTTLTVTAATLTSIAVTPLNPSIPLGTTQQFIATGTYSNNTMQDITTAVTWSSSSTGAPVSNAAGTQGVASGSSQVTATITATLGTVAGHATLTVTAAALQSIAVTPTNAVISVSLTQQYTAIGTYTDTTTQDLTASAAWTSSVSSVAAISSAAGSAGLATATGAGTTQIVATVGTIASPGVTLTVKPATYAYVTNTTAASISQYIIGLNGTLTPQSIPTVTNPASPYVYPYAITVTPNNTHAYMADARNDRIYQFQIGTDGGLLPLTPAYIATVGGTQPNSVTLNAAGTFLYVANNSNGTVDQFTVNTDGTLTLANTVTAGGAPVTVTFDPTGHYAYVSSSSATPDALANRISQFSVDQTTGFLSALTTASVAANAQPEGMAFDPTGSYMFAADTASAYVNEYTMANGFLTPNTALNAYVNPNPPPSGTVQAGSQNVTVTFDLTGKYVYVAAQNGGSVSQFALAANGTLTPIGTPSELSTPNGAQSVTFEPTNHFAYVTIRSSGVVLIYSLDPTTGLLTPASNPSVNAQAGSTSLATTH